MLINTVILFLRDALPIFILLAILIAQVRISSKYLTFALGAGLLLAMLFILQIDTLSEMFDGAGIELTLWLLHLLFYCNVVWLAAVTLRPQSSQRYRICLAIALMLVIIVAKGSNFLLYLHGYLNQINALQSLFLGTLLGLGICLSVAVLLYFFVAWLRTRFGVLAASTALLIFAAGQLSNALNLLIQVDLLPNTAVVWDSGWLVDDQSEYGYLFNVLIGYVATPSYLQLSVFVVAITVPWIYYRKMASHFYIQRGNKQ